MPFNENLKKSECKDSMDYKLIEKNYCQTLATVLGNSLPENVSVLCHSLVEARNKGNRVYICGNGGSSANALHIANDLLFVDGKNDAALNVEALTSNTALITCIANDLGYKYIFSKQLEAKAKKDDVLLVLSGSGNSDNVIEALNVGQKISMKSFAILGFSGGKCKALTDYPIHFELNDMQVVEDLQLIIGHICMKALKV